MHKKQLIIIGFCIGILVLVVFCLSVASCHVKASQKNNFLAASATDKPSLQLQTIAQLNQIENQLKALQNQPQQQNNLSQDAINHLDDQLRDITARINTLTTANKTQETQKIVQDTGEQIIVRINSLQQILEQIKRQIIPPHYLPVTALHFQVRSILSNNGMIYVAVDANGKYQLITKNDYCNGWQLVELSMAEQRAVFQNEKQQLVKVQLAK